MRIESAVVNFSPHQPRLWPECYGIELVVLGILKRKPPGDLVTGRGPEKTGVIYIAGTAGKIDKLSGRHWQIKRPEDHRLPEIHPKAKLTYILETEISEKIRYRQTGINERSGTERRIMQGFRRSIENTFPAAQRSLGTKIVSEWRQHRNDLVASIFQRKNMKLLKNPVEAVLIDASWEESDNSEEFTGMGAEFTECRSGVREFNGCSKAFVANCSEYPRARRVFEDMHVQIAGSEKTLPTLRPPVGGV
ncbi:hypothetical protein BJ322DRAFT_1021446 [Thelephora terrestris]|uniref:Uncharacterized protein n=1 Tax=Thelephora terrestris TaxID=56493 RepID=A0A9P6HE30_9AGAM|nr:hypothetical protein BJ322DRAFT_1021446 [Thelephora terrestris]